MCRILIRIASTPQARQRSLLTLNDGEPVKHPNWAQLRTFDAAESGADIGVAVLLALSSSLLEQSLKDGLVVVGALNLGGSIDPVHNAVDLTELAAEHRAQHVLMPVSAREQLFKLPDEVTTALSIQYYSDVNDALVKGLAE